MSLADIATVTVPTTYGGDVMRAAVAPGAEFSPETPVSVDAAGRIVPTRDAPLTSPVIGYALGPSDEDGTVLVRLVVPMPPDESPRRITIDLGGLPAGDVAVATVTGTDAQGNRVVERLELRDGRAEVDVASVESITYETIMPIEGDIVISGTVSGEPPSGVSGGFVPTVDVIAAEPIPDGLYRGRAAMLPPWIVTGPVQTGRRRDSRTRMVWGPLSARRRWRGAITAAELRTRVEAARAEPWPPLDHATPLAPLPWRLLLCVDIVAPLRLAVAAEDESGASWEPPRRPSSAASRARARRRARRARAAGGTS